MRVFRIKIEKYLSSTLLGIGAAMSDGFRWNSQNTHLVYTSESSALATLEVSVHLDLSEHLPIDRYYLEIEIPEDIMIMELDIKDLPKNWNSQPPSLETQYIGDDFVLGLEAALLKVPSCIGPPEANFLINPFHPDAKRIRVVSKQRMEFDQRIKK